MYYLCLSGSDFQGVPLVPLQDKSLGVFKRRTDGSSRDYFFGKEAEQDLLKEKLSHILIDNDIPEDLRQKVVAPEVSEHVNVTKLSPKIISGLVSQILPAEWKSMPYVIWKQYKEVCWTIQVLN